MTEDTNSVRVWLVERSYSDDKPNLINLVYATTDGERYLQKERALTGLNAADAGETTAALDVDPDDLRTVDEETVQQQYMAEATRMANTHDPDTPM